MSQDNTLTPGMVLPYRVNGHIRYFVYCSQESIKGDLWVRGYDTKNERKHVSMKLKSIQSIHP